jgi:protein tyrosine phosphatase (PTP) superfamily phosphohydrolase (DUF442 family)
MDSIYNFYKVSDLLACSGQPSEGQLSSIAAEGYRVVINLGLKNGKYALTDEAATVQALGMAYHYLPVPFDNPKTSDLVRFIGLMNKIKGEKILVHCAANYRASTFTGLYLFSAKNFNEQGVYSFIEQVWQPDAIWERFIEEAAELIRFMVWNQEPGIKRRGL